MDKKLCATCAALAVLALAMALPQGSALAKGLDIKTADLCRTGNGVFEERFAIGTAAPVTDNRRLGGGTSNPWTAWAVSLEDMLDGYYGVYNDPFEDPPTPCGGNTQDSKDLMSVYESPIPTPGGTGFRNSASFVNPEVEDTVWICRRNDAGNVGEWFDPLNPGVDLIPILSGVLVKGGKQQNKRGRCPPD